MRKVAAILALASAGASLTLAAGPAFARSHQVLINYSDLNLNAPQGRATLQARLENAARLVCGPSLVAGRQEQNALRNCRQESVEGALARIGVQPR